MDRYEAIEIAAAVAETGSFVGAARALGLSPPAVTRGVAALEARLGVMLFHRSTRAVSLTDEGARFLAQVRPLIAGIGEAEQALRGARSEPSGQLYITAPVAFGRLHVLPVVGELIDRNPLLDIRMMLIDRNVRIVEEGMDVAVRIGALADSSLKALRIGSVRQVIVASPGYLSRYGAPDTPRALVEHRTIALTGPRAGEEWHFGDRLRVSLRPRLRVNTVDAAIAAIEAGVGIGNLLSYQADAALASGRMIEILAPETPAPIPVQLLFEAGRGTLPAMRAFIDAMRARARDQGWGA